MNKKKSIIIISLVIISIAIVGFIKINSNGMNELPKGEFISESQSPNGEYVVRAYICNGGATVDYAVRGELINLKTKSAKTIYWDYHIDKSEIKWNGNNKVIINGHEIDIPNGVYDWRKSKI